VWGSVVIYKGDKMDNMMDTKKLDKLCKEYLKVITEQLQPNYKSIFMPFITAHIVEESLPDWVQEDRESTKSRQLLNHKIGVASIQYRQDLERILDPNCGSLLHDIATLIGRNIDSVIIHTFLGDSKEKIGEGEYDRSLKSSSTVGIDFKLPETSVINTYQRGLHEGKILEAIRMMRESGELQPEDRPIVIASKLQLALLQSRALSHPYTELHKRDLPEIDSKWVHRELDGFLGCRYISYQSLGMISDGCERVLMILPRSVQLFMKREGEVSLIPCPGGEYRLQALLTACATRMSEDTVVEIECDTYTKEIKVQEI